MLAGPQTETIDGVTYHVLPLPAGAAMVVAAKVLRMASPAFSDVGALVAASKAVNSALEALTKGLLEDLDADVLLYCAREFAKVTTFETAGLKLPMVSDKGDLFDEHFRGRFVPMLKWLAFAASVSFPFVKAAMTASANPPAAG